MATEMGHLDQESQNVNSTQSDDCANINTLQEMQTDSTFLSEFQVISTTNIFQPKNKI